MEIWYINDYVVVEVCAKAVHGSAKRDIRMREESRVLVGDEKISSRRDNTSPLGPAPKDTYRGQME